MKPITLTDIFLEVLSRNSDPDMRAAIAQIKITLKIPECAELFNIILINAIGYKSIIRKDIIDRAMDCAIDKNKLKIDRTDLNEIEKKQQKQNCEWICRLVQNGMLDRLKNTGQLIE